MANFETEFVKIIKEICDENNLKLESFDDWAFRVEDEKKRSGFIYGYQFGLDNAAAVCILKDKAAASAMMTYAGIKNIPHWCVMNPLNPEFCTMDSGWNFLLQKLNQYGRLVLKDNQGTGGRLVYFADSKKDMEMACQKIFSRSSSLAVSPYEDIKDEYRVIVLDGRVRVVFRKERPALTGDGHSTVRELICARLADKGDEVFPLFMYERQPDFFTGRLKADAVLGCGEKIFLEWKHNLGQGSRARTEEAGTHPAEERLALDVMRFFGLRFASVDVAVTQDGPAVLEINGGVMMENLSKTDAACHRLVKEVYTDAVFALLN